MAIGAYGMILTKGQWWGVFVAMGLILGSAVFMFWLLRDLDPMEFGLGSLCLMELATEASRMARALTGGVDGIYLRFEGGIQAGLLMSISIVVILLFLEGLFRGTRPYFQSHLLCLGMDEAEAFGVPSLWVRFWIFLPMAVLCGVSGIAHAMAEGYVTTQSLFYPGFTLIPVAAAIISRRISEVMALAVFLVGLQEFLGYMGVGIQGIVLGLIVVLLPHYTLLKED